MPNPNLPTYEMTLPSLGLFYGEDAIIPTPSIPGGVVKYTPMTTREEKFLAGAKGGASIIDHLISNCVYLPEGFSPSKLLLNDRFFILLHLRSISYGEEYNFTMTCPDCSMKFQHSVEIPGEFEIRTPEADQVEPFSISLPVSESVVGVRMLRGEDEKLIQKMSDKAHQKSKQDGDPAYIYRLARHIVTIDGEEIDQTRDFRKAIKFVEELIAKDSLELRNGIEDADFGIDVDLEVECRRCDNVIEQSLPLTSEFFRPRR